MPPSGGMNSTQAYAEFTAVLADAGAKPCVRCGKRAAVHAVSNDDGLGAPRRGKQGGEYSVWVCFECGFEESAGH